MVMIAFLLLTCYWITSVATDRGDQDPHSFLIIMGEAPRRISLSHISSGTPQTSSSSQPPLPVPPQLIKMPSSTSATTPTPDTTAQQPPASRRICLAQVNIVKYPTLVATKKKQEVVVEEEDDDDDEDEEEYNEAEYYEDEEEYYDDDDDDDDDDDEEEEPTTRKTVPNTEAMERILAGTVKTNEKIKVANVHEVREKRDRRGEVMQDRPHAPVADSVKSLMVVD